MFGKKKKQQEQNLANQEMQNQNTSSFDKENYQNGANFENSQQNAYYNQNNVEPLSGEDFIAQNADPNEIVFVPGQNGVPANITQQGLDNLVRAERLYRNGVIGEQAYYNLQQKIFNTFLG